jgi:transposase
MTKIGEEITEELDYEPGLLFVNCYIRPKYARADGNGIIISPLPSRPIEKGIAGPGLLAHLAISKYLDHLPLYRQRQQFKRQGVDLSDSTVGDWIKATCELIMPLYNLHKEELLKRSYLMADETPIRVLDGQRKGQSHTGYFWVYYDPLNKEALFDYRQSRSRAGPVEMLANFQGHLQVDGYNGYDETGRRDGITLLGCMAHARRYFEKALPNDKKRAAWMLEEIRLLYMIERFARNQRLTFEERLALRRENALPIMTEMRAWLDHEKLQVLPKSQMGKAIGYMLTFWERLLLYMEDGRFEIDNNLVENAIRPIALGRKNYLFV